MRFSTAGLRFWMASNCASVRLAGRPDAAMAASYEARVQAVAACPDWRQRGAVQSAPAAEITPRRVIGPKETATPASSSLLEMSPGRSHTALRPTAEPG